MSPDPLAAFPCWVCYAPEGATLRFDKKRGNPFVSCGVCGTRVFAKSRHHLRGIFITTRLVEALLAQVAGADEKSRAARAEREREAEDFVRAMRARLDAAAAGATLPQPTEQVIHEHVAVSASR